MKFWPFGTNKDTKQSADLEPSTFERLTERKCNREEFFLLYSKLLQERMPDRNIEFLGESVLRIVRPDGKESTAYLDNLWLKYSQDFEDHAELLEKYVRMYQDLGKEDIPPDKQNIVAIIKDSEYFLVFRKRGLLNGTSLRGSLDCLCRRYTGDD